MSSNPFPQFQQPSPEQGQKRSKRSPKFISKLSSQKNLYFLVGAIVVGVLFLFLIGSIIFGSGGSSKKFVYKENENREYLLKKAEHGNAEAMFKYSNRCKTPEEGVKWLKKSAEKGYARAQFYLGVAYTEGIGKIEANSEQSNKWLTKSSKKGFSMAKVYCLYKGIGVEPDKDKAWKELEKGARAGFVENQMALASVYAGKGPFDFKEVDKSEEKAQYWLEKAAENGLEEAQMALAEKYYSEEKFEESVKWFKKAAIQGRSYAQYRLGKCYLDGKGVEQNNAEAKKWLQKAADQGSPLGKLFLKKLNKKIDGSSDSSSDDSSSSVLTDDDDSGSDNDSSNSDDDYIPRYE